MDFLQPSSWHEALAIRAERPDALPIAGGTDVMVELNFDRRRPAALLDLTRVGELREWSIEDGGTVRLGAGVPYARVIGELGDDVPDAVVRRSGGHQSVAGRRQEVATRPCRGEPVGVPGGERHPAGRREERAEALGDHLLDRPGHVLGAATGHPGPCEGEDAAVQDPDSVRLHHHALPDQGRDGDVRRDHRRVAGRHAGGGSHPTMIAAGARVG